MCVTSGTYPKRLRTENIQTRNHLKFHPIKYFSSTRNSSQDGNSLHIKVVEVIPKFTFLGKSLDEALNLQKQHEDLLLNIQVDALIYD